MKRKLACASFFSFLLLFGSLQASAVDDSYQRNMTRDFARGFKNALTFPLDVPRTVNEYHKGPEGRPVVRHFAGLVDGIFRGIDRAGSAVGDFLAAFIPGHQEGWPVQPETLI